MDDKTFAKRIHERFPEGLTGLFAIGGTRTSYILENNRYNDEPGKITDFSHYSQFSLKQYMDIIEAFVTLGGQNMVISALSFRSFFERGPEYADLVTPELGQLIGEELVSFYRSNHIDPYFVGLDTLLRFSPMTATHQMAKQLIEFQNHWIYQDQNHKLVWEIASIPLYTFWRFFEESSEAERAELRGEIESSDGLEQLQSRLYHHFCKHALGFNLPVPHFYVGTCKSGDLKIRSPLMISLTAGEYLRMYYTPYPSLFMKKDTLKAIIEDLALNERFHSTNTDYKGQYTPKLAQKEYDRILTLSANPNSVLGFTRRVSE